MKKQTSAPEGAMLVAKESFAVQWEGEDRSFLAGITRVRAGHPVLQGREHLFEPLAAHYEIEQATDAPGERRGE